MLFCDVIVQETPDGETEIATVDPVAFMAAVGNQRPNKLGSNVQAKLKSDIQALWVKLPSSPHCRFSLGEMK